mmetsp:Transcript_41513/g.47883  ORF Transcript_41513/g.47883 Transcript_41513/m.47883 type:complete len:86 (+) Transcript_41513:23-280(+)
MSLKLKASSLSISEVTSSLADSFDFEECDSLDCEDNTPGANLVKSSLQFSNKLYADKGNVKEEDREDFCFEQSFESSSDSEEDQP